MPSNRSAPFFPPAGSGPAPKKSLGQHFLHEKTAIRRILDLLDVQAGDQVLEIGPGPGALTGSLRSLGWSRLLLIEKDDAFAAAQAARPLPGLEVLRADALVFDWKSLSGPWKLVGNLPYNIASPLIWDMVSRIPSWERAVFMLQKEVAERVLAPPGGRTYGALTVWIRSFAVPRRGFSLGPGAFRPPPRVESSVIVLHPLPPEKRARHPAALAALLKLCFGRRRKQLGGILGKIAPGRSVPDILAGQGIDPQKRPETLAAEDFQRLAQALLPSLVPPEEKTPGPVPGVPALFPGKRSL
jgi:16S rRNA (adenine1518-N6/adenine1519-N6)-dimethyltransferase